MARAKPSIYYFLCLCSLGVALLFWGAAVALPHMVSAVYLTSLSSKSTSDAAMQDAFAKATSKTGIEAVLRPRGRTEGDVMLMITAPTDALGKERTAAMFGAMQSVLAERGKGPLIRINPHEPTATAPFFIQMMADKVLTVVVSFGVLALLLLFVGQYKATGAQPPQIPATGPENPSTPKGEFDY